MDIRADRFKFKRLFLLVEQKTTTTITVYFKECIGVIFNIIFHELNQKRIRMWKMYIFILGSLVSRLK